jgi:nicotinic acid mononucleotide adenylyltransferase
MGADSWAEISTWRDCQRLLTMANHIVVTRPGYEIAASSNELSEQLIDIRDNQEQQNQAQERQAGAGRKRVSLDKQILEGGTGKIFLTDVVMKDISATEVRRVASEGNLEELTKLVPEAVAEYIGKYGIYRKSNEGKLHSQRQVSESAN